MTLYWKGRGKLKPSHDLSDLFKGAFILTIAALITKILSAVYRIPFQNIVGDTGFYIYQQVYPFYGVAVVLATTGFPVVISKLFAECREKGNDTAARRLLVTSFLFLQLVGLLCFTVLYAGAGRIAIWMHDPKLALLLKAVSFIFLLFPLVSVLRGYYQGNGDMVPTAVSQIGEQSIRVLTIIVSAYLLTKSGHSLYVVGSGAMFGSITGSVIAAMILFTFFLVRKEWKRMSSERTTLRGWFKETGWIYKALIFQGLGICMSGMLLTFIQMADALNLYSLLVTNGVEKSAAQSLKGIFDRGQPLIQLGTVAATSLSLSLVPLIASRRLKKQHDFLIAKIRLALKLSIVVGIGASAGLWAIIGPTNIMLFENNSGSSVLGVLSFVILFSSLISTITAIMQGLGNLWFPALVTMLGFPIKYGLNLLLVPRYETMGAAISTIITLAVLSVSLFSKLKKIVGRSLLSVTFFRMVGLAALIMVLFLKAYLAAEGFIAHSLVSGRLGAAAQSISAVFFGAILFLWVVVRNRVFSKEDLSLLPFGSKLSWFLKHDRR